LIHGAFMPLALQQLINAFKIGALSGAGDLYFQQPGMEGLTCQLTGT
jgi:hypothetical protein